MTEVISSDLNPELAAAAAQEIFAESSASSDAPTIHPPAPGFFRLAGGLVRPTGGPAEYEGEVRELNGEDEEYIYRVMRGKPWKAAEAIIERGLVSIDGKPCAKHEIRSLLLGDAQRILVEIRRATYGDEMEWTGLTCPHCGEDFNLTLSVDDIPDKGFGGDRVFEVPLRRGGKAKVHLPRLSDIPEQVADATNSEVNTVLLARTVISTARDGQETIFAGSTDAAKALGVQDRRTILTELGKRSFGPELGETKFTHETCGEEVPFPLTTEELFPGFDL